MERILSFTQVRGQFEHYLGRLRGNARQRNSALAELRVAFFFSRNGFRVVEWELMGANKRQGEFAIKTRLGKLFVSIFLRRDGYCRDPLKKVKMEEKSPDLRQITRILFCRGNAKERSGRTSW